MSLATIRAPFTLAARWPRNGSMIPAMGMNFVANWTTN